MELSGQLHVPATLPPRNVPWYLLYNRLGAAISSLDDMGEILDTIEVRSQNPSVVEPHSQSLYRLRYFYYMYVYIIYIYMNITLSHRTMAKLLHIHFIFSHLLVITFIFRGIIIIIIIVYE
jgi:hypothetical protein